MENLIQPTNMSRNFCLQMHENHWVHDVPLSPLKYPQLCAAAVWFGPKSTTAAIRESSYIVIKYVCVLSRVIFIFRSSLMLDSHFLKQPQHSDARVCLTVSYVKKLRPFLKIPPIETPRVVFFTSPELLSRIDLVSEHQHTNWICNESPRKELQSDISIQPLLPLTQPPSLACSLSLSQWNYKWKSIITHIHSRCAQKTSCMLFHIIMFSHRTNLIYIFFFLRYMRTRECSSHCPFLL